MAAANIGKLFADMDPFHFKHMALCLDRPLKTSKKNDENAFKIYSNELENRFIVCWLALFFSQMRWITHTLNITQNKQIN